MDICSQKVVTLIAKILVIRYLRASDMVSSLFSLHGRNKCYITGAESRFFGE